MFSCSEILGMQSATQFLMHQEVQESATTPNTWNSLIASTEASKWKYQKLKKKKPQPLFNTKVASLQNRIAPAAARDQTAKGGKRPGDKGQGKQHITSASATKTGIQKCQTPEIIGKARAIETSQWKRKKFRNIYRNQRSPWDLTGCIHEYWGTSWHRCKPTPSLRVMEAFWTGSRRLKENRRHQTARSN